MRTVRNILPYRISTEFRTTSSRVFAYESLNSYFKYMTSELSDQDFMSLYFELHDHIRRFVESRTPPQVLLIQCEQRQNEKREYAVMPHFSPGHLQHSPKKSLALTRVFDNATCASSSSPTFHHN
ncbi:uncharacterized protein LOC112559077 [Pomacea canaliculata]|uniref:uncharacterized protein LOC112559077 n=1 Tax=Pomacea canaliculata TaxID=400727 RepID=UPI000D72FED8|nr:uncharacterized protein LOC112559077 [Pomacea canaliculata]